MRIHNPSITGSFTVTGSKLNIDVDGNITSLGSVTANQYIVSSSVTNISIATNSGSTAFGDTTDDTHQFTGSLSVRPPANGGLDIFSDSDGGSALLNIKGRAGYRSSIALDAPDSGHGDIYFKRDGQNRFQFNYGYTSNELSLTATGGGATTSAIVVDTSGNLTFGGTSISGSSSSTGSFGAIRSAGLPLHVGSTEVGIGTTSPTIGKLEINPSSESTVGLAVWGANNGIKIQRANGGNAGAYAHIFFTNSDWLHMKMNGGDTNGIGVDKIGGVNSGINPANNYIHFNGYNKEFYGYNQGSRVYETHDNNGILIHLVSNDTFKVSGSLIQFTPTEKVSVTGTIEASGNISGSATSTGSFGQLYFNASDDKHIIQVKDLGNANLNTGIKYDNDGSGGALKFTGGSTWSNEFLTVMNQNGARIGLNVANPQWPISISAAVDNEIILDLTGNGYFGLGFSSGGQHRYLLGNDYSTNTTRFSITAGGYTTAHDRITIYNALGTGREHYIGINKGATNPVHSLDVSGSIVFANGTQSVQISGSSTSTGSFGRINLADSNPVIGNNGIIVKGGSGSTGVNFRVRNGSGNDGFRVHGYGNLAVGGAFGDTGATTLHIRYIAGDLLNTGIGINEYIRLEDNSNKSGSIGLGSNGNLQLLSQGGTTSVEANSAGTGNFTVAGKVHIGSGTTPDVMLHLSSATDAKPAIKLEQTGDNNDAGQLIFLTSGTATTNDDSGVIRFKGMNNAGTPEEIEYATIYVNHDDITDGSEDATMFFRTQGAGTLGNRLKLDGSSRISISNNDSGTDNTVFGASAGNNLASGGNNNTFFGDLAGHTNSTGDDNTYIGKSAGQANSGTGDDNTFVGSHSGYQLTGGSNNTGLGVGSLQSITSGTTNVAVGSRALHSITTGAGNVAIGQGALDLATTQATYNIAIGQDAMNGNWTTADVDDVIGIGRNAIAGVLTSGATGAIGIGYNALSDLTSGAGNTAIGYNAGAAITSAAGSTFIGQAAGQEHVTGGSNTAIGQNAMYDSNGVAGYQNLFVGVNSGAGGWTTGAPTYNVGIGNFTLDGAMNGATYNTTVGYQGLSGITTGDYNTAVGGRALDSVVTGTGNTAVGFDAGGVFTGGGGVFMGYEAGLSMVSADTALIGYQAGKRMVGTGNVGLGYGVLYGASSTAANNTGTYNTAMGVQALRWVSKTVGSTGIGAEAGYYITGSYNTFVGYKSGYGSITSAPYSSGGNNTGVGYRTLHNTTSGNDNVAIGFNAGVNTTTASGSVMIGSGAGDATTTGNGHVIIGHNAGGTGNQAGLGNVVIGALAGNAITNGGNEGSVAIGYKAGAGVSNNNFTVIGYRAAPQGNYEGTVALGFKALFNIDSSSPGEGNHAIGHASLFNTTTGGQNTGVGRNSGLHVTTGTHNTFIGYDTRGVATGLRNTAIGALAMNDTDAGSTSADSDDNIFIGYDAGGGTWANAKSEFNIAIGNYVMDSALNGALNNIGIGHIALSAITTGDNNIGIGSEAGSLITTGLKNISIGVQAGKNIGAGGSNVAVGHGALTTEDGHGKNIAIGDSTLYTLNAGADGNNVAIGHGASYAMTTGVSNIAIGSLAMQVHTTGTRNIAIGVNAMDDTNAGSNSLGSTDNIFMGYDAGGGTWTDADSNRNVTLGNYTMDAATAGALDNVAVGHYALSSVTSGDNNTALGSNAGLSITTGADNVVIGYLAGDTMTGTGNTVLIGKSAGQAINSTDANYTIAIGFNALSSLTNGQNNIAMGGQTQTGITTGDSNITIGYNVMSDFNAGANSGNSSQNIAIGTGAMGGTAADVASNDNIAIGANTLAAPLNGALYNIAIGVTSLNDLTTGDKNVSIGNNSLQKLTTGESNTAIGYDAGGDGGSAALTGNDNTLVGDSSGLNLEGAGHSNTFIGSAAGAVTTTGVENTTLGFNTEIQDATATNQIVIGNNVTGTADNAVHIGNDTSHIRCDFNADQTWDASSDKRQKKEIQNETLGLDFINDIRPVTFKHKSPSEFPKEWNAYNADDKEPMGGDKVIHGLIAQEVKEALDNQSIDTFGGWSEGDDGRQRVSREMFITPLIKSVQELSSENKELKERLNDLEILIKDKLGDNQ